MEQNKNYIKMAYNSLKSFVMRSTLKHIKLYNLLNWQQKWELVKKNQKKSILLISIGH